MPIRVDRIRTSVAMESAVWEGLKDRAIEIFDEVADNKPSIAATIFETEPALDGATMSKISIPRGSNRSWYMGPSGMVSCYDPKPRAGLGTQSGNLPLISMASPNFDIRRAKDVEVAAGILIQNRDANMMALLDYSRIVADVSTSNMMRFVLEDVTDHGLWKDLGELLSTDELSDTWGTLCHPDVAKLMMAAYKKHVGNNIETSIGVVTVFESRLVPTSIGGRSVQTLYLLRGGRLGVMAIRKPQLAFLNEDEVRGSFFLQRVGFAVEDGSKICVLDAYPKG